MFGNSPETSVWADNHPEPQSLLERCASFLRRNSDPEDLVDYTVGIEEVRRETQTRIRVDVDMSQYAEDENLPSTQHIEEILDPYYWPNHDEFLAEAEDYAREQRSIFGGIFGRPAPFSRRSTGTFSHALSLAPSTPREDSNYTFVPEGPASGVAHVDPQDAVPRTVVDSVVPIEARMSGESVRYFDEEGFLVQKDNSRKNSTNSLLWPWNWRRHSKNESSVEESSESSQRQRSGSAGSAKSLAKPATWFSKKNSLESTAVVLNVP